MRKACAFFLVLTLIVTSSTALASSVGAEQTAAQSEIGEIPELDTFAKLTASVPDEYERVTVTLDKPVDRLWANWMGNGEEPEELYLNGGLSVTFSTKGHPYQVGTLPPSNQELFHQETAERHIIQFGALESQVNWRRIQAENDAYHGDCVEVVRPRWILYRISDEVVFDEYDDKLMSGDIQVPEGFRLQKVEGYAVSWRYGSYGSDGSPNLAYITLQNGYIVIYARNGKIQYVTRYEPGVKIFGIDAGVRDPASEPHEALSGYYVPESIKEYEDLPELPASYSFAGLTAVTSGDGKTVTVFLDKPVDRIWANWMGKDEEPEELTVSPNLTAKYSTEGHKYQVGTQWVGDYKQIERGRRYEIVWGAYNSRITWATIQAMNEREPGDLVKVVLPHWELQKISTGEVVEQYDDDVICVEIDVPEGYKLVKKDGYAVAYYNQGVSSDGSPNLAYITEQKGYIVVYARSGKIMSVTKLVEDSNYFGLDNATAAVRYDRSMYDQWYVSEVTEVYDDNRSITAIYNRFGNGKLASVQVTDF